MEAPSRDRNQFDSGGFSAKKQTHPMSGVYLFFGGTIQNRTGEWRFCRPLPYRLAMVPNIDFTFLPSLLRGRWLLRAAPSKDGWGGRKSSTGRTRPPVQNLFDHSPDGQNCRWQPVLNLEPALHADQWAIFRPFISPHKGEK